MLSTLFRPSLILKFADALQHEGLARACIKAREHIRRIWRGEGRSAVPQPAAERPVKDSHYLLGTWRSLADGNAFHISHAPATLSKRRKIALIGDLNLPQCRKYRVEQLAEFWRGRNVDVTYSHYQDVPRSVQALQDATHLIEYRLHAAELNTMYRYEARRLRIPVLYDIDDPLFSVSAYEGYNNMRAVDPGLKSHFVSEAPKYLDMMNGADVVSVSTPDLAEHARLYTSRPVFVRRNFADRETLARGHRANHISKGNTPSDGLFRLAFSSGSQGHEMDFETVQDVVAAFLSAQDNRRLMILGHFDLSRLHPGLRDRIEPHAFTCYSGYLDRLAHADCAIMPLADDMFNRCKSAVRVLDAAAVAVPSIVGAVSDAARVVQHGKTGFVAQRPRDWATALDTVARDSTVTRAMGEAARSDLETRWSALSARHVIAPELIEWVMA